MGKAIKGGIVLIDIRDTIAKIIYIGSVSEKGRCVGHWGMQYKKLLKDHMNILFEFSEMLFFTAESIMAKQPDCTVSVRDTTTMQQADLFPPTAIRKVFPIP